MTKRSWLAKARSVHDLGGHFYVHRAGRPWDEKRDMLADRKALERAQRSTPVAEEFRPFFGSRMHDSKLLEIKRTNAALRVTLDSIDADIFNYGLADALGVARQAGPWPVDLLLHDPRYVRAARHDPNGALRFVDWERLCPAPGDSLADFLNDWFHEDDGRLQWIANFYSFKWGGDSSHDVFLMVDCARATACDRRRSALVAAYGPAVGVLWDDALEGVEAEAGGPGTWGDDLTWEYLTRRLAARGLSAADFVLAGKEEHWGTRSV